MNDFNVKGCTADSMAALRFETHSFGDRIRYAGQWSPSGLHVGQCWHCGKDLCGKKEFGPDTDTWMVLNRYVKKVSIQYLVLAMSVANKYFITPARDGSIAGH